MPSTPSNWHPECSAIAEPRTYLVLFTSPVEERARGGSVVVTAELLVDDGQLSVGDRGGVAGAFSDITMTTNFPQVGAGTR